MPSDNPDNLPTNQDNPPEDDREQKFIEALATSKSAGEAGLKAGYSKSYCTGTLGRKFRSERFLKKLRTYYNGHTALILPKILQTEVGIVAMVNNAVAKALKEYDDPNDKTKAEDRAIGVLSKTRHTLKELKQVAGVLQPDQAPGPQTVHVHAEKALIQQIHNDKG